MSSTDKGNAFEQRVYDALDDELRNGRLCVSSTSARIFRKKAYRSRDRGADIITDVSVEVFLQGHERPTLLWIFECKDYTSSVPVGRIEEFHSKLQQIGEDNTKGTFVTSGALQKSALAVAQSNGIGVIRLLPDGQISHVLERMTLASASRAFEVNWSEFDDAITNPGHCSRQSFFAEQGGYLFGSWQAILSHELSLLTGA